MVQVWSFVVLFNITCILVGDLIQFQNFLIWLELFWDVPRFKCTQETLDIDSVIDGNYSKSC